MDPASSKSLMNPLREQSAFICHSRCKIYPEFKTVCKNLTRALSILVKGITMLQGPWGKFVPRGTGSALMTLFQSYLEINQSQEKIPFSTLEVFSFFSRVLSLQLWSSQGPFPVLGSSDMSRQQMLAVTFFWHCCRQVPRVQADRIRLLLHRKSRAAPFAAQNFGNFLRSACFVLVRDQLRMNLSVCARFTAEVGRQSVHE